MERDLKQIKKRTRAQQRHVERMIATLATCCNMDNSGNIPTILLNEKDSAATLFTKLSQLLLKWSELELSITKELGKSCDTNELPQLTALSSDELAIVESYIGRSNDD